MSDILAIFVFNKDAKNDSYLNLCFMVNFI